MAIIRLLGSSLQSQSKHRSDNPIIVFVFLCSDVLLLHCVYNDYNLFLCFLYFNIIFIYFLCTYLVQYRYDTYKENRQNAIKL